jgi:hypothetical protein
MVATFSIDVNFIFPFMMLILIAKIAKISYDECIHMHNEILNKEIPAILNSMTVSEYLKCRENLFDK